MHVYKVTVTSFPTSYPPFPPICACFQHKALFTKLGLNGKPAHTAPLQPPLQMSERVVVTHREVSAAGEVVVDTEETQALRQAA